MTDTIANKQQNYIEEAPLVEGDHNFSTITEKLSVIMHPSLLSISTK